MNYSIRNAEIGDLFRIEKIYAFARTFMAQTGNPHQWGMNTPQVEQIVQYIQEKKLYLICDEREIHGVFFFEIGPDPTYLLIHEGEWRKESPYGVIHRIAGDGSGGILRSAVSFAKSKINYLRIDTHHDNFVMQNALAKQGFQKCGIIYIEDGTPRIAYDYFET